MRWVTWPFINRNMSNTNEREKPKRKLYIFFNNLIGESVGAVHCGMSNALDCANFQERSVPQECEPSSNTSSFPVDAGSCTFGKSAVSPRLRERQHFQACSLPCPPTSLSAFSTSICALRAPLPVKAVWQRDAAAGGIVSVVTQWVQADRRCRSVCPCRARLHSQLLPSPLPVICWGLNFHLGCTLLHLVF